MLYDLPKRKYEIEILTSHADYLDKLCVEKDMTPNGVVMLALRWYQLVMETPGALEAIDALRPKFSKLPPMPTLEDVENALENLNND